MKRSIENGTIGILGAVTSITSALYTHVNAAVALLAGLLGLIAAAFAAINGYYQWRHNRKEAAREDAEEERQRQAHDSAVTKDDEAFRAAYEERLKK